MLKVYVIGRLVKKPELQKTKNDKSICEFDLAESKRGDDEHVNYLSVVVSGTMAENVVKYLDKGSRVGISGELRIENYERKDKSKGTSVKIQYVDNLEFLGGKRATANDSSENNADGLTPIDEDDLPF